MYRTSSLRRVGYLEIDHTDSPGIPEHLARKWQAQGTVVDAGSTRLQCDTYTCGHCGVQVIIRPERTRDRAVCRQCMKVVCDNHVLWCRPWEQLAEQILSHILKEQPDTHLLLPAGRI